MKCFFVAWLLTLSALQCSSDPEGTSTIEPIQVEEDEPPPFPLGRSASPGLGKVMKNPYVQDYLSQLLANSIREDGPTKEPLDPDRGLENVKYIEYLLMNYPMGRGLKRRKKPMDACDVKRFKKCTCIDPPMFTKEGRGNCNVGSNMSDKKVWCYINPSYGSPVEVCPDATVSEVMKGYFWSRIACITDGVNEH